MGEFLWLFWFYASAFLILAANGFEQIQTTQDTQGIWRVVEGTINS